MEIYKAIEQASVIHNFNQTHEDENTRIGTKHFTGVLVCNGHCQHGIYTSLFVDDDNKLTYANCFPGSYMTLANSAGLVNATLENRTDAEKRMGKDIHCPDQSLHITLKKYKDVDTIHVEKNVLYGAYGANALESYQKFVMMHTQIDDDDV
jgi:hypothetical protein